MSKGLKALQDIRLRIFIESEVQSEKVVKDLKIIEKELKEYEETKKDLEQVMSDYQDLGNSCYEKLKAYEELKKEYLVLSIKERALEIIKKKVVDIYLLYATKTLEDYNSSLMQYNANLTQEEYDLLKEVFLCR